MNNEAIDPLKRGQQIQQKKRFSISLPADLQEQLRQIAANNGMTMNQLIEQAAELEIYIRKEKESGSTFYIERLNEKIKELIL